MTKPAKRLLVIILLGLVLSTIAASHFLARDDSLSRIQKAGFIRIGYALEPPYALLTDQGEVSGESPEVARIIVRRLGIPRIEWRLVGFSELIEELNAGHIDVIAAGMFITRPRQADISFSEPTFHVQPGLLVAEGNPHGLNGYADALRAGDLRLATLTGSIEEGWLRELGAQDHQLLRVPDAQTGRIAVETAQAAGLALSQPTLRWMRMQSHGKKTMLIQPQSHPSSLAPAGYGAFGFRKQDAALRTAWNTAMKDFINSPEHEAIIARFGFSRQELPGSITTQEVLAR